MIAATVILSVLVLLAISAEAYISNKLVFPSKMMKPTKLFMSADDYDLDIGDFDCVFKKAGVVKDNIYKFTLDANIDAKALNSYLAEYQEEMKRRKVVFPGFRPGKLPPYVMGDVRKYLVCYGLETMIGQLCNSNGLRTGEEVQFGEDAYYEEIIKQDSRGFNFEKQRDAWREGTPFSFSAEFYAEEDKSEEGSAAQDSNVVDTTAVDAGKE